MAVTPLEARLVERIRTWGPIGFDEFMDAALYDPDHGFYVQGGRGPGADFVTSPEVSPLFGATLATAVAACHELMDDPVPFTLCEVGAGRGRLMAELLAAAADAAAPWIGALEVVMVERGLTPAEDPPAGFRQLAELSDVRPFEGVLLANEVLDNLPVRLLAGDVEARVAERAGRLTLVPDVPAYTVDPVGIRSFLDQVGRVLARGVAIFVDYGAPGPSERALRTFSRHSRGEGILSDPGERDVTASVDWDVVEVEARARGFDVLGRRSQRETLLALGLGSSLATLRSAELSAAREQDTWQSLRMRDRWSRASALVDPAGLGGFEVLVLGRGMPPGVPWERQR